MDQEKIVAVCLMAGGVVGAAFDVLGTVIGLSLGYVESLVGLAMVALHVLAVWSGRRLWHGTGHGAAFVLNVSQIPVLSLNGMLRIDTPESSLVP